MKTERVRSEGGMSLVELMVSMTIMMIVITAASALFIAGTNMAATTERRGATEDAAHLALETVVRSVVNAGMGVPAGLWVRQNSANVLVSPVFGIDGTTDDLWLVVADRNVLREPCTAAFPGAATVNFTTGTGNLSVSCAAGFSNGDMLLATNMVTGALLSGTSFTDATSTTPATIQYAESGPGYSDSPAKGGFQAGDLVFKVKLTHYFVQVNPLNGNPALYTSSGTISTSASGPPFIDGGPVVVQDNIEDFQVRYFSASNPLELSPVSYIENNGLGFAYNPSQPLRAVQITVVARTPLPQRMQDGRPRAYHPVAAENHDPGWKDGDAYDGFERVVYSRRIELPNLAPGLL
jgi:type II secretory pathway pseudopilin PulG